MRTSVRNLIAIALLLFSVNVLAETARVGDGNALIIIDMQPHFVTRGENQNDEGNKVKVKEIIKNQIEAIKEARKLKIPIVFIEYEGHGETNAELKKAVEGYDDTKIFLKNTDGMFSSGNKYKSNLIEYLKSKEVGSLIISGANGGACVLESISGSLENNYNVIAINKGIADFNFKEFIYPYEKKYSFTPTCENCKFKEADSMEVVILELTTAQMINKKKTDQLIDDSARDKTKVLTDKPKQGEQSSSFESVSK